MPDVSRKKTFCTIKMAKALNVAFSVLPHAWRFDLNYNLDTCGLPYHIANDN